VQICYNDNMDVRSKIWLEVEGETVFGSGRHALLAGIDKLGSINKAAKSINISNRKALSYIQNMEHRLSFQLVERHAGGKNGGGAHLTEDAKDLLLKYEKLERGINELLDLRFLEVFGNSKKQ